MPHYRLCLLTALGLLPVSALTSELSPAAAPSPLTVAEPAASPTATPAPAPVASPAESQPASPSASQSASPSASQSASQSASPSTTVAPVAPVSAVDAALAEINAWNAIRNSENIDDYKQYVQRFPASSFVELAQFRMRELETRRMLAAAAAEWTTVRQSDELAPVEAFLQRYPEAPQRADAEALAQTLRPLTLVVHYLRQDQGLLGWSVRHDASGVAVPFDRMDDKGVIAHLSVKARQAQRRSTLSLARGSQGDDCGGTREISWERPREVWLLQHDCTVYESLATAQRAQREREVPAGKRRLHYVRADGRQAEWRFVLKNDKLLSGLLSLLGRKEGEALLQRDRWGSWADWTELEGQAGATLLLELSDGRDQAERCEQGLRWPADAGREAWYIAGSCKLLFSLEEAIKARRAAALPTAR